jgi:RNA polymerase sigma-70 factor (ECF subfamily)
MKKAAELREQVLLLRCQIGDRDAFEVLFERYERPLRYFINRLLDNSELTEDIFQDTWLTVIRRIHGLKEVDAFPAWLYRIARN